MLGNDGVSGLEQAIRNALERAERSDPDIRARIYQSARNALDVGLRKQDIADPAVIERQRQRLEVTIGEIEDEELARLRTIAQFERVALEREPEPEVDVAPSVDLDPPEPVRQPEPIRRVETVQRVEPKIAASEPLDAEFVDEAPAVAAAPRIETTARFSGRLEPTVTVEPEMRKATEAARSAPATDDGSLAGFTASRESQERLAPATVPAKKRAAENADYDVEDLAPTNLKRRGIGSFLVSTFVYLFLIGIIGGGVWWVYDTGMINAALEGSGDFQLVPKALQSESKTKGDTVRLETLRGFSSDWIDIYKPGTSTAAVVPRDKAVIEEHRDSDGLATVITSNAPDQDGDVLVEIPAAYLQEMSGKTSTLAVTVKSNSDKPAQIYIQCEFKSLGDCGRHRYTVTNERADELIQMQFEGKLAPSTPGHIVINSDLTGEGSSIRLYGIRVLPGS